MPSLRATNIISLAYSLGVRIFEISPGNANLQLKLRGSTGHKEKVNGKSTPYAIPFQIRDKG